MRTRKIIKRADERAIPGQYTGGQGEKKRERGGIEDGMGWDGREEC